MQLYGQPPAALVLSTEDAAAKSALLAMRNVDPATMQDLHSPIDREEVVQLLRELPPGKAADPAGLTCELLKCAATAINEDGVCASEPVVSCIVAILQHIMSSAAAPGAQLR